jgi:sarcosine oxidase
MRTVVVVGAGSFGSWTALQLAKSGYRVTLIDAFGPGNSRASSGGETRLIRMGYGAEEIYTQWSWRSLELWKDLFEGTDPRLFRETGVLWMARDRDRLSMSTLATLGRAGIPHQRLSRPDLESRWPQIDFGPITWAIYEPASGVLLARRAVAAVVRDAERESVRYISGAVRRPAGDGRLDAVITQADETISGDTFVFACGAWLAKLFPDLLHDRIVSTRQEVLYFGPQAGDVRFAPPALPAWIDFGEEIYGVPDVEARGFKVAVDRHGPAFDPDSSDRLAGQTMPEVREYLGRRFPSLAEAPLVAYEVCQYENTCNGDFLIDRHPELENVWLIGGGSGHGFKHGPAVGEYVARLVTEEGASDERFRLTTKHRAPMRTVY